MIVFSTWESRPTHDSRNVQPLVLRFRSLLTEDSGVRLELAKE
jgi:hypothetical protein